MSKADLGSTKPLTYDQAYAMLMVVFPNSEVQHELVVSQETQETPGGAK